MELCKWLSSFVMLSESLLFANIHEKKPSPCWRLRGCLAVLMVSACQLLSGGLRLGASVWLCQPVKPPCPPNPPGGTRLGTRSFFVLCSALIHFFFFIVFSFFAYSVFRAPVRVSRTFLAQ